MSEESKNKSVFRQGNAGEEQTAENLNEYIRTGSAGGYFLIAALIIVVVALFIWGFVGRIPVNITETSVVTGTNNNADLTLCFVDVKKNTGALPKGTVVSLKMPDGETFSGEVIAATEMPVSTEEAKELLKEAEKEIQDYSYSDWAFDYLMADKTYSYALFIETGEDLSEYQNQIAEATITTGEVRPISLLMK